MTSPVIDQSRRGLRSWQAGLALSLLGAALLVIGLVQTTSSTQAHGCPDGTSLVAKFNYQDGSYVFEKGDPGVVSVSGSATSGTFTSGVPISRIIVKGSNAAIDIKFTPPQTAGSFSNAKLPPVGNGDGNIPDISNLQFCTPNEPPPTTTTTTATSEPETTTTATSEPETTTTATSEPGTTTTSEPGTTTTTSEPSSSTSTSTTGPASSTSTSTTQPQTTTTAVEALPPGSTTSTSSPVIGPPSTPPGGAVTSVAVLPPPESPSLPVTGTSSTPLIVLGLLILGAGVTLVVIGRARERRISG